MEDGKLLNSMPDEEEDLFVDAVSDEEEWVLARKGIQLVLNNRYTEAQKLFTDRKDSIQLAAGHCFVVFMNALMSFEEDKLAESLNLLRELEKRCAQDIGWLKSIRNKVFGNVKEKSDAARLEEQVILADTQVCLALLTFLQQDVSGCVRGGWVLRKAWKVYQHTYTQILNLYRQTFGPDSAVPGSDFSSWRVVTRSPSTNMVESPSTDWSVPNSAQATPLTPSPSGYLNGYRNSFANIFNSLSPTPQCGLAREDVSRLMAAVSFGYGVFQLCVSLLPPSLLKLIQVLGFGADRDAGLEALMFARQGPDMRAPLATLALLWYHTIVRPFFALDGTNMQAGIETASHLVADSQLEFSDSALFLFFTGRIHRLMSDVPAALKAYLSAVNKSPQREVQLLCMHEVSWCYLIQLDWPKAYHSFMILKKCSRWSKIFYTYLAALCAGANDKLSEAVSLCQEIRESLSPPADSAPPTAHTQLEHFVSRRAALLTPAPTPTSAYCRLLAYEILFLWNTLPAAQYNCVITKDCESSVREEPMVGLRSLILGTLQGCLGLRREAVASLRAALSARQNIPDSAQDSHVTAFALYELARLLIQEAREYKEEARSLLERAQRDFKGYDFESRLNVRIHAALRSLGH